MTSQTDKNPFAIIPMDTDNEQHRNGLLALWEKNFRSCRNFEKRFNWLYQENPFGVAKTWFVINHKNEIVGCSSAFPRKMYLGQGKSILAWVAADLAVNKEYRILGPALALQRAIISNCPQNKYQVVFAHPNKMARGVIKRVKYFPVGKETYWTKPLRTKNKIKKYVASNFLAKSLGFFTDSFFQFMCMIGRLKIPRTYSCCICAASDEKFDVLWSKTKSKLGITTEKTSAYLNWRFAKHQDREIKFYCMFDANNHLKGYIAYSIDDGAATIEDLLAEDMADDVSYLLAEFSRQMRKNGIDSILLALLGGSSLYEILKKQLFFQRGEQVVSYIYFHKDCPSEYKDYLLEVDNWFLCGDFDI